MLCYVNGSAREFPSICALAFLCSYQLYIYSKARGAWTPCYCSFSHFSFLQLPLPISPEKDVGFPCPGGYCAGCFFNLGL